MAETRPQVSVVIATRARPALLARGLGALARQTLAPGAFEVVVVDDGPHAVTRDVVTVAARAWPQIAWRYLEGGTPHGPAVARNRGWRAARAPVVAFTDDDTVALRDWLARGIEAMDDHAGPALAGRIVVPRARTGAPSDHERMTRGLERAEFATANAFVRRDALQAVGGFDERFARAWREDSDLQFRLEACCGPVARCDAARVLHPVRPERWGVSLRQQKNVFFDALLYRQHPRAYRERVRPRPPWSHYAVVACALAALGAAATRHQGAALLGGACSAGLVLRLAWTRLRGASLAPGHVVEMVATSALIPFLSVWWRLRGAWHWRTWFV